MSACKASTVFMLLTLYTIAYSQNAKRCNASWFSPAPDQTYQLPAYEVTEQICSAVGMDLCVFIKRNFDLQPILVYRHHRAIALTLGHRQRLVLINDREATKSAKVLVVDLKSGLQKQIDKQALTIYRSHAKPDRRLIILPEACEFSPDDKMVHIEMVLEYVSVPTRAEAIAASRTYRAWSYAVDARTGKVLREYRSRVPKKSW